MPLKNSLHRWVLYGRSWIKPGKRKAAGAGGADGPLNCSAPVTVLEAAVTGANFDQKKWR